MLATWFFFPERLLWALFQSTFTAFTQRQFWTQKLPLEFHFLQFVLFSFHSGTHLNWLRKLHMILWRGTKDRIVWGIHFNTKEGCLFIGYLLGTVHTSAAHDLCKWKQRVWFHYSFILIQSLYSDQFTVWFDISHKHSQFIYSDRYFQYW